MREKLIKRGEAVKVASYEQIGNIVGATFAYFCGVDYLCYIVNVGGEVIVVSANAVKPFR